MTDACAVAQCPQVRAIASNVLAYEPIPATSLHSEWGAVVAQHAAHYADVVCSVDGVDFPAHRVVLACRSSFFSGLFDSTTQFKEHEAGVIVLQDCDVPVFRQIMR